MLHLHPRVHLDKVEGAVLVQELERTCTHVANLLAGVDTGFQGLLTRFRIDIRRRGFFDDFLVPALHGAVTVAKVDDVAVGVRQYLHFDVAGAFQIFFEINRSIPERVLGFRLCDLHALQQGRFGMHHLHAAATTARGGFDNDRIANSTGNFQGAIVVVRQRAIGAGHGRDARCNH